MRRVFGFLLGFEVSVSRRRRGGFATDRELIVVLVASVAFVFGFNAAHVVKNVKIDGVRLVGLAGGARSFAFGEKRVGGEHRERRVSKKRGRQKRRESRPRQRGGLKNKGAHASSADVRVPSESTNTLHAPGLPDFL